MKSLFASIVAAIGLIWTMPVGVAATQADDVLASYSLRVTLAGLNPTRPDFLVERLHATPAVVNPGDLLTLGARIQNPTSFGVPSTFVDVYLSYDQALDPSDERLATMSVRNLGAIDREDLNIALQIPSTATAGIAFLLVSADASNLVAEESEGNNLNWVSVRIGPADAIPLAFSVEDVWSSQHNILPAESSNSNDVHVLNIGGQPTPRALLSTYLSADLQCSADDRLTARLIVAPLAPGEQMVFPFFYNDPPDDTPLGYYFVLHVVEPDTDLDDVPDAIDNCPQMSNAQQEDLDHDGIGDACDLCPGSPDPEQSDIDQDGAGDACDVCTDVDRDGAGLPENVGCALGIDCDDHDASRYPGAVELCDGLDNDCSGGIEGEVDADADGVWSCHGDCNDLDPAIHPGAIELPGNVIDENCDGSLGACDPTIPWRNHGQFVRCVAHEVDALVASGLISEEEGDRLISSAAQSSVGKK